MLTKTWMPIRPQDLRLQNKFRLLLIAAIDKHSGEILHRSILLEGEPSTMLVQIRGAFGIREKLLLAFPGPYIPCPGNQAVYILLFQKITNTLFLSSTS